MEIKKAPIGAGAFMWRDAPPVVRGRAGARPSSATKAEANFGEFDPGG